MEKQHAARALCQGREIDHGQELKTVKRSRTKQDLDEDIEEDVGLECSKYERVNHIYVDKMSAGFVYLRFDSVHAIVAAQHMRWFVEKMISATFMPPHEYEAKAKA